MKKFAVIRCQRVVSIGIVGPEDHKAQGGNDGGGSD
jgi:hypothetical protein